MYQIYATYGYQLVVLLNLLGDRTIFLEDTICGIEKSLVIRIWQRIKVIYKVYLLMEWSVWA
ncbi:hypothetical protein CW304_28875 [Bacillus sp. UFRGS-B20]|nr:hypothetical protein CW304_28875 [Bacillus sp. UFRGS-B20]